MWCVPIQFTGISQGILFTGGGGGEHGRAWIKGGERGGYGIFVMKVRKVHVCKAFGLVQKKKYHVLQSGDSLVHVYNRHYAHLSERGKCKKREDFQRYVRYTVG